LQDPNLKTVKYKFTNQILVTVNLTTIDEFSEEFYNEMLKEKNILEGLIKSTKKALIHQMVS